MEFNCQADAEQALRKTEQKWPYHYVEQLEFQEVQHYEGRGRPKKESSPVKIGWNLRGKLAIKSQELEYERRRRGRFIIATNSYHQLSWR